MDSGCYHGVRVLAEPRTSSRAGWRCGSRRRPSSPGAADGADLLWLESPSNPTLEVYDIAALAGLRRDDGRGQHHRGPAAPAAARPRRRLRAHERDEADERPRRPAPRLRHHARPRARARRSATGAARRARIPGPFETWLAHRSLPTLALRLERGCDNALAIARLLAARDDVEVVRYPGLPSDPGHEVARRQMRGYGMVVSFDLGTAERAESFLASAELVTDATSFGSVHTVRGAARPLGRRRRPGGLHPALGGLRGDGRSSCRRRTERSTLRRIGSGWKTGSGG